MAPALLELFRSAAIAGHGAGADQLGEPFFGLLTLQAAAPAILQRGAAAAPRKTLAQGPALADGFKGQLHLRFGQIGIGLHALEQIAAGFDRQEQGAMQGLGQGALAGLVGSRDHGEAGVKLHRQVAVQAVITDTGREQTHGVVGSNEARWVGVGTWSWTWTWTWSWLSCWRRRGAAPAGPYGPVRSPRRSGHRHHHRHRLAPPAAAAARPPAPPMDHRPAR